MSTTIDAPPGPGRGPALMRALGLLFAASIAFATLYPLVDWRLRAAGGFTFLLGGLPRYWTWFDVLSNVLAYGVLALLLTLGWLVALSAPGTLQPRLTFGLVLLAALQLAMSAIVVLKPALLGPPLGVW